MKPLDPQRLSEIRQRAAKALRTPNMEEVGNDLTDLLAHIDYLTPAKVLTTAKMQSTIERPMKKRLLLSVDFDETCARIGNFPEILGEVPGAIAALKELHADGHRIQIWTCRHDEHLDHAREWLDANNVPYERINENCPSLIDTWGDTRKMGADIYIDDKMLGGLPPWPVIVHKVRKQAHEAAMRESNASLAKMPHLIALSGKRGSGKNTVAALMQETNWMYREYAFAAQLKKIAQLLTGATDVYSQEGKTQHLPDWNMTVGEILQRLGTEAIRNGLHENAWILACFAQIGSDSHAIITDCRFPNEAEAVKARGGIVIRVEGDPMGQRGDGSRNDTHPSETAMDDYPHFDAVIQNDGTVEDLREQVERTLRFPYNHK